MQKAICILGGMGPGASSYMYDTLIKLSIRDYGAKKNDDFPEIILHSIPVPDFISDNKSQSKALQMLKRRVRELSPKTISSVSIACNTAHVLLPQLQKISNTPFISIIDETVKQVHKDGKKIVGLMATPSTIKYGLYQTALDKYGISTITPSQKEINVLEQVIRNVLKGKILLGDRRRLEKIVDSLKENGAEAIILGCTELPLVFPKKYSIPVYNSVEILSKALLRIYYGGNTIQG